MRTTVKLDKGLYEKLEKTKKLLGRSRSEIIQKALEEWISGNIPIYLLKLSIYNDEKTKKNKAIFVYIPNYLATHIRKTGKPVATVIRVVLRAYLWHQPFKPFIRIRKVVV